MNIQAEYFFEEAKKWKSEFLMLREIIGEHPLLEEEYKWKHPCYTFEGKNIVLIHGFKEYCALLFHKGALLKDRKGILIQQTSNVQSARQIRFTSVKQVSELRSIIKEYLEEAIEIERSGKKVQLKEVADYPVPEEFHKALQEDKALKAAFNALSPGRQKAYLFYFNQAKQSKTREVRIEKYYQHILDGKGIKE